MRRASLFVLVVLTALPAAADDWLLAAEKEARAASITAEPVPEASKAEWITFTPPSRLFSAEIPVTGWRVMEEEGPGGTVVRLLGPDSPSGDFRAVLSVRQADKGVADFLPLKQAVEVMRRPDPAVSRSATPVRPMRIAAGLARAFEIVETRRLPSDDGPGVERELHHYVAVIPTGGDSYLIARLVSSREDYLSLRDDFVRFLKSLNANPRRY